MPIKIRKNRGKDSYKVYNSETGEIHSHAASYDKALKQKRMLEHVEIPGLSESQSNRRVRELHQKGFLTKEIKTPDGVVVLKKKKN